MLPIRIRYLGGNVYINRYCNVVIEKYMFFNNGKDKEWNILFESEVMCR